MIGIPLDISASADGRARGVPLREPVFYFSSTTGEKMAKENTLTPFAGMWMATFILLPVGLFLTYKAMRDSQLFNKDAYSRIARFFGRLFGIKRRE